MLPRMGAALAALATLVLAGCNGPGLAELTWSAPSCTPAATLPDADYPEAVIETNFGTIRVELFLEQVPRTVGHFIDIAEAGDYDGTPFHRIITGFMMQGGGNAQVPTIPDEFHKDLRHDRVGRLSMANAGPDTGKNQFFITFGPTPHLDDRHTVFGQVTEGFDVLTEVNETAATQDGQPSTTVTLQGITIEHPDRAPVEDVELALWTPDISHAAREGGKTRFLVVVENLADRRLPVCLGLSGEGADGGLEPGYASRTVPAGQRVAFQVEARLLEGDEGTLTVTARTPGAQAEQVLSLTRGDVGPALVVRGDEIVGHYIGMTTDGRIFDTSMQPVANAVRDTDRAYSGFQYRGTAQYAAFTFVAGGQVIQGFTDLAMGTEEGATTTGRIQPQNAYNCNPASQQQCPAYLGGRTLLFQLQVADIT